MAYEINRIPYIKINLKPGIYTFDGYSATGKTYLGTLIDRYKSYEEKVCNYTLNDLSKNRSISDVVDKDTKVLFIDTI